ncbi:MAG: NUDIX hydrolase [Myxococcota bacterium]
MKVDEQRLDIGGGKAIDEYHLISTSPWVATVAVDESGCLILVEQYRHGAGRLSLELPAGVMEAGEAPAEAARRELREETGYDATSFEPLLEVCPEPARNRTRAHLFVATGAVRVGDLRLDETENIDVVVTSLADVFDAIDDGRIVHGVHIGAILLAHRRGLLVSRFAESGTM